MATAWKEGREAEELESRGRGSRVRRTCAWLGGAWLGVRAEGREVAGRTPGLWLGDWGDGGAPPQAGRGFGSSGRGAGKSQLLSDLIRAPSPNSGPGRAEPRGGGQGEKLVSMFFWLSFTLGGRQVKPEREFGCLQEGRGKERTMESLAV